MPRPRVLHIKSPMLLLKFVDIFLPSISFSIDAITDSYTKPLVKPLPLLYHHFLMM